MRIVLIGVSHWHTPFYLDPLLTMPDMSVIGVSDPDVARAERGRGKGTLPGVRRLSRDVRAAEAGLRLRTRPPLRHGGGGALPDRRTHPVRDGEAVRHHRGRCARHRGPCRAGQPVRRGAVRDPLQPVDRNDPRESPQAKRCNYIVFKFVGGMVDRYHEQRVPMDAASRHRRRRTAAQSRRALPRSLPRAAA